MTLSEILNCILGALAVYYFNNLNETSKEIVKEMHNLHLKLTEITSEVKTHSREISEIKDRLR
jgi:uncharacterized membrane-anchored protein YhcB (DUF1043 family)